MDKKGIGRKAWFPFFNALLNVARIEQKSLNPYIFPIVDACECTIKPLLQNSLAIVIARREIDFAQG
jgi:hypothetical protein